MQKHIISTDKAPQAIGTYSQAIHVAGVINFNEKSRHIFIM